MHLPGSSVVVTGATSGIGRETAILLAARDARVWAVARSGDLLDELADAHDGITALVADVTTDDDRAALVDTVGPIDVLVNNAGIGWTGLVEDMPGEQMHQVLAVNLVGLVDLTRRVLPGMLARGRGHVVNVASVASWVASPPLTVYCATKFAVQGFTDGLSREVAGRGVAVTAVNPGPVATKFWARAQGQDRPSTDVGDNPRYGVPATLAARAVLRSIRMGGLPGYQTIAVPRVLGFARLGALPGLRLLVDAGAMAARRWQ
ncbi:MAG: SDR family NAD(P)-dependent oxidoreductase [Actinomycetota bacterium]|nr:SDR family NAD(P)-dependent oxidoreductase [Actinomycetota bacterium]